MRRWAEIRNFVGFDAADEAALAAVRERLRPHFSSIVRRFYEVVLAFPDARRVFTEGDSQVERLRGSLMRWLDGVFTGPWDESYFEVRTRIGRIHVRIGLAPRFMALAMHGVRAGLIDALEVEVPLDLATRTAAARAIRRICDMELAVMLETYGDEFTAQLTRRERLAVIGQIGASISHEVKNPLGVISSSLFALREHRRGLEDQVERRHFDRIRRNVEQIDEIVTSLLDLLRDRPPSRVQCVWAELVARVAGEVPLPEGVRVECVAEPSAGSAMVDPAQIARVITNLVRNAAEASPEGGRITVTTSGDEGAVVALVRDRGSGVSTVPIARIFEPLFTTKDVGTGLGLALAKAIVDAHAGTITVANHAEGGAEFKVRLPRGSVGAEGGVVA